MKQRQFNIKDYGVKEMVSFKDRNYFELINSKNVIDYGII